MRNLLRYHCSFFSVLLYGLALCRCALFVESAFCEQTPPVTIAFASDVSGNWEIYLTNTAGQQPVNLTHNPAADYYPMWSLDGDAIVFFSKRDANYEIYVMHADGTQQRRLTHHPAKDKAPAWAPDSNRIAFISNRKGHYDLYLLHLETGVVENLTENGFADEAPSWSPDGERLVFHSKRHLNWDIYTINVRTREEQRLTHQPLMDTYPAWSPDGKRIVYSSMRIGAEQADFDLYLMDAIDGANKNALTDTPTDEAVPAWVPDGRGYPVGQCAEYTPEFCRDPRVLIRHTPSQGFCVSVYWHTRCSGGIDATPSTGRQTVDVRRVPSR